MLIIQLEAGGSVPTGTVVGTRCVVTTAPLLLEWTNQPAAADSAGLPRPGSSKLGLAAKFGPFGSWFEALAKVDGGQATAAPISALAGEPHRIGAKMTATAAPPPFRKYPCIFPAPCTEEVDAEGWRRD